MIRSFKKQLNQIADRDRGGFASALRSRSATALRDEEVAALRSLVMTMPELLDYSWNLAVSPATPSGVKALTSFAMTYLYHPRDLLPENELGLLGYLDDAYVVASAVQRSAGHSQSTPRRWSLDMDEILQQAPRWLEIARKALPKETRKLDQMLDDLENGKTELFEALLATA